jgi:hypothetical protein
MKELKNGAQMTVPDICKIWERRFLLDFAGIEWEGEEEGDYCARN